MWHARYNLYLPQWPSVFYHFQASRRNRVLLDDLPLTVQITTRVPGRGGGWWTDTLVVVLHLKPDWSSKTPEDIQQALEDQLPLFLLKHKAAIKTQLYIWMRWRGQWDNKRALLNRINSRAGKYKHSHGESWKYTLLCAWAEDSVLHNRGCMSSGARGLLPWRHRREVVKWKRVNKSWKIKG